jgi:integrase
MYRSKIDQYLKPAIGRIRLVRLSPSHIEAMQADLIARVSATTVSAARVILNGALKKAVRMGLIRVNPVAGTDAPKMIKPKRYPLTVEEALSFLEACEESKLGVYFRLVLATGIRPEEAMGLQWANLRLGERGVVHVKRVIIRVSGQDWKWAEPKSENGVRSIVFPADLVTMLVERRKTQLEQKMKLGKYWQNNDLVFCTGLGTPFRHNHINREFKAILNRIGLPKEVRMYDLRHFFVTSSLLAGVDPKTVSDEAGHATVAFTLDHYGNVLNEMRETASDKRAELMRSRGKS